MQPDTREQLSASPLVWSHSEYVLTVKAYLDKLAELERTELDLGKK
jgi:GH15 family glucan-1,4-alpha-glucosidase